MIFLLWIFVVYWVEARRFRCIYLSLSHRALRTNGVLKLLLVSGWVGPPSEVFILKTSLIRWSIAPFRCGTHFEETLWSAMRLPPLDTCPITFAFWCFLSIDQILLVTIGCGTLAVYISLPFVSTVWWKAWLKFARFSNHMNRVWQVRWESD